MIAAPETPCVLCGRWWRGVCRDGCLFAGHPACGPTPPAGLGHATARETDVCATAWWWLHWTDVTTWGPGREREGLLQFVCGPQYDYLGFAPDWVLSQCPVVKVSWRARAESDDSGVI
jgi:hypothetical protein